MGFRKRDDIRDQIISELGKIRPAGRRNVFVFLDEIVEDENGGDVLVSSQVTSDLPYREATVLSIGDDVTLVNPGDCVVLGKFYGKEMVYSQSSFCKLKLVSEDQIAAVWVQ